MKYKLLAQKIIELKTADLEFREELVQRGLLGDGYHKEMEALHIRNAEALNDIMDTMGYPTIEKVGKEASMAAWLVILHAISKPDFMRKCLKLLTTATIDNNASPKNLAFLTDRIAVFSDELQLYGTQFDWDTNGLLSPNPFDDVSKVNQRRKSIGLNTLEEQIEFIRSQAEYENQTPPSNFEKRKREFDIWRKGVGWAR